MPDWGVATADLADLADSGDRVDLWACAVTRPTPAAWQLLSADERSRAVGFRVQAGADAFVCTRALLRRALGSLCGVPAAAWQFSIDAAGRPWIAAPQLARPLYFSLSHAGGMAVCAVARQPRIGVDIEALARPLVLRAVRRVLADTEIACVEAAPPAARDALLLRLWTLKEAYGKAVGLGLTARLREVAFSFEDAGQPRLRHVGGGAALPAGHAAAADWSLRQFSLEASHLCALALDRPRVALVLHGGP